MIFNGKIKKILSCSILAVFFLGEVSFSSTIPDPCLSPPLYLKPACGIVVQTDGTYEVKVYDPKRSKVEFLWFLVAQALDKGLEEAELRNIIYELFQNRDSVDLLETFDVGHITKDRGSFLLPFKKGNNAFRFFAEASASIFGDELINDEKLFLSSGNIIRFSLAKKEMSHASAIVNQDEEELTELSEAIKFLWNKHKELWQDLSALRNVLSDEYGLQLIKASGKKFIMYSKNKKYILKVNWEEDYGYAKEKVFFLRDLAIPSTKIVFYHDASRTIVLNNVTINNDSILFYDYLRNHLSLEDPAGVEKMMKDFAKIMADIHSAQLLPTDDERRHIFRAQDGKSQMMRIQERCDYLRDHGYKGVPPMELFREAQSRIGADDIVVTHGDPSPWNSYVDVEEGRISAVIDTETSSEESRYKDMSKVIISLIDASKNAPHMLGKLEKILTQFFEGYFASTGIDRDKAFRALSYYLGTQLLWYTEETERIFSVPVWVEWRLELCRWALEREKFEIKDLIRFLAEERDKLAPVHVDNLKISDRNYTQWVSSGEELAVKAGEKINIHLEVTFPKELERKISGLQLGVELWTDMGQEGAWYGIPAFELKEMHGAKAIFEGEITPKTPGFYRMTARVVVNDGRPDAWADNKYGDIKLLIKKPGFTDTDELIWGRAIRDSYSAVIMDYDGTIKDYDGTIPEEIYDACSDMIRKGVHVCVNTSRSTPGSSIDFFDAIRERMGSDFRPQFCHVYYGLGYYDLATGAVEGIEVTPEVTGSIQTVLDTIRNTWLNDYIMGLHVAEKGSLIGFYFKGKTRKDIFARFLNKFLEEMNLTLPESVVAVYADNIFQIIPKRMTKQYWMEHFINKTGIPADKIVRIGDQGQRYGVDRAMCGSYGGFTVNHETGTYIYPLSTSRYLGLYGIDGTAWLLKNLRYVAFRTQKGSEASVRRSFGEDRTGYRDAGAENGSSPDTNYGHAITPEPGVWELDFLDFAAKMFENIKTFITDEMLRQELVPAPKAKYNSYKPKSLILYADSLVESMGFLDMGKTFSEGFFKSGEIFEGGSVVLYGTSGNCGMLREIIEEADPAITVFTLESTAMPSEIVEIELVADKARRVVSKSSGMEYEFVGLIKGKTDMAVDLVKVAKDIKMPIILFNNDETGIYSFCMALTEAFNRRYSGSTDRWVCCLNPITKLSIEAAEEFRRYIFEQYAVATRA